MIIGLAYISKTGKRLVGVKRVLSLDNFTSDSLWLILGYIDKLIARFNYLQ
jgi:hypothetical protein